MPVGVDINAYEEGHIVNGNYDAIKTTGFNQFNGTYAKVCAGVEYHLGGTYESVGFATTEGGEVEPIELSSDALYTPSRNGYIYATGENIVIHCNWAEYHHLAKDYHPYKPFTRDLSWVHNIKDSEGNLLFEDGMKQAGSVRDEISFNSTTQKWEAVKRVGVRSFVEGDDTDSTVTTDGKSTNYTLATPIVVEFSENINLDYDCSDYGTEELIANGESAPLVADIVYEPNVLATIKNQPDILKRLAQLEAQLASLVSASATSNEIE